MNISGCIPFLILSVIVLCGGSAYYLISNIIRSRLPKRINCTNIRYIHFHS